MATPRVLILRAPGANCDWETQFAFELAGAKAERVHINRLRENARQLHRYQILCIPGGFTYGDDVAAGKILGNQLRHFLGEELRKFRAREKLILGICNGFQALLKAGLIVPPDEDGPLLTLTHNRSRQFEDRWVYLRSCSQKSPFLKGFDIFPLPVAHAEGRIAARQEWLLDGLEQSGQVALKYVTEKGEPGGYPINPNGSPHDIAALCDASGRVLGMMPHPERNIFPYHHPRWTRLGTRHEGEGLRLFRNAVEYFS